MNKQLLIDLTKINNGRRHLKGLRERRQKVAQWIFDVLPDKEDITKEDIDEAQAYLRKHNGCIYFCPEFREVSDYLCDNMRMYIHHTETDYLGDYERMRKRDLEEYSYLL